jgi:hypothetical protein
MVDGTFQWIGVGVAYGAGRMWVAVEFMNGAAPPAPPPPPPPPPTRATATNPRGGYYVLKGNGNVLAKNGAPSFGQPVYPFDVARSLAVMPDGRGYAVLDAWGGVHLFGSARALPPTRFYWPGWDIARSIAITPDGRGYVVLDGWGGLHRAGDAPRLGGAYFRGLDIARSVAITPDNRGVYVLDGWGGVHASGTAVYRGGPYWRGFDIANAFALTADGRGYAILDGFGGIHVKGNAPPAFGVPYVRADVWRGLSSVPGGYIATRTDGYSVHA